LLAFLYVHWVFGKRFKNVADNAIGQTTQFGQDDWFGFRRLIGILISNQPTRENR